jgi:hypothetical protein
MVIVTLATVQGKDHSFLYFCAWHRGIVGLLGDLELRARL